MIELRDALLRVRIVRWPLKLAYVVGAYAVTFLIIRLVGLVGLPAGALQLLGFILDLAAIWYGTRVFRGRNEPLEPPRPWWQLTARPTASGRIGGVSLALGVLLALDLLLLVLTNGFGRPSRLSAFRDPTLTVLVVVEYFVIGIAYLHSSGRLRAAMRVIELEVTSPPPLAPRAPAIEVPHEMGTSRRPVTGGAPATLEMALAGRTTVRGLLANGTDGITLSIDGVPVGHLKQPDQRRFRDALDQLPAPLAVVVLLTGDRLWAELPEPGDVLQLGIDARR